MDKHCACLVIDMQQEDGFPLHGFDRVIHNHIRLLDALRPAGIPILFTRHLNRADGRDLPWGEPCDARGQPLAYRAGTRQVEILDALAPAPGDRVIDKPRYSAFHRTDLDSLLRERGIRRLIVTGVLTDACVLATVQDAFALGYRIDLIADACTSTTEAAHQAALLLMANWVYALELFATEQYLRRLAGQPWRSVPCQEPDAFAHAPEQFVATIARLQSALGLPGREQE
ncbi:isochorismatase family cysteine hydrolase [Metapseudomonas furukawaii]|jgi:nicotinamidase-related amidase|uniref:Predicted amidohydrolase RutB in novel pyrimidine catabolism pathway n=1 Tax=Metapseudomonas furukawaii TaxID=1149133 RepID=A0AAD1C317_METFU|nr:MULTISPECIES: isochorismatase family cysteine hydrolase [Pseudomonas]ELS26280.1 putative amidohydrolase RutB [Pseudomonas furukawaii]OWJ90424.1 isochorismatase [Pseudomonas sp. A46]BAU75887.1 predicted amidohydrolase RutB in novel pyrimidine catabolism pathway [Pseudomonas furukawaii]